MRDRGRSRGRRARLAGGLTEVWAMVRPGNDASLAVCRRLGMTPLGLTTRWYRMQVEQFRLAAARSGTMAG